MRDALWVVTVIVGVVHVSTLNARERLVTQRDDLAEVFNDPRPGDVFVLADGAWEDAEVRLVGKGTDAEPITLRAQTPGKVVFTGESRLRFSGRHIVVDGLFFRDVTGESEVIMFRSTSHDLAHHCRVTNCAIVSTKPLDDRIEQKWVSIYGTHNRVDHCYFAGKRTDGTTLVVWVAEGPNDHRIDHNHFGHRPPLGRNGGETIRVGTSEVSLNASRTIVESNLFERCDGEAEIISSKSCENVYHANTFLQCAGALTLRHGDRCRVEGNFFLGEGARRTGGVRIIGRRHVVVNNYFSDLTGDEGRSAISFMNGIPHSPLHGYFQVEDAVVAFNTLIDCKVPITIGVGAGKKQSLAPVNCVMANNVFIGDAPLVREYAAPLNWTWAGNQEAKRPADLQFALDANGLWRPESTSPVIGAADAAWTDVSRDIDGHPRGANKDVGCDQQGAGPLSRPLTADDVGPEWLDADDIAADVQ